MTGSEGEALAVEYLAKRLEKIGAVPLPGSDGYSRGFEFTAGMHDGGSTVEIVQAAYLLEGERGGGIEQKRPEVHRLGGLLMVPYCRGVLVGHPHIAR